MKNVLISIIQERRLQKGYNFYDIEQAIGIPAKRMFNFEKGLTHLSLDELELLFTLLDLDQRSLLSTPHPKKKKRRRIHRWLVAMFSTLLFVVISLAIYTIISQPKQTTTSDLPPTTMNNEDSASLVTDQEEMVINEEPTEVEATIVRFWGNIDYDAVRLPTLYDAEGRDPTLEVFSVEHLQRTSELPHWLMERKPDHVLLNFATRNVWGKDAIKERDRLNKLGIKNIGLDYKSEAYKPYIIDTPNGRIGFLAFTRHILAYEHIAKENQIGLARIYDTDLLTEAIQSAKEQVDVLVVLIGWGEREDVISETLQQDLANVIVDAGADVIIGNHPKYAQEIRWLGDAPVFYSLGHPVANETEAITPAEEEDSSSDELGQYAYVIDIEVENGVVTQYVVYPGKWIDGQDVSFELTVQEKSQFETHIFPAVRNTLRIP